MRIETIKDKNLWEGFLKSKEKTFLHSWNWGEFQKDSGEKVFRLGFFEDTQLLAVALIIKVKAKRGNFFLVPHGPIIDSQALNRKEQILNELKNYTQSLSKNEKANFLRVAPLFENNQENRQLLKNLGFKEAPLHIHPETTWVIDISKPEEEIFASFRKVHRNLIRRAQKEGVIVKKTDNQEAIETFNSLYQETAKRQKFVPFSEEYLKKEFEAFKKDNQILVFNAFYQNKPLSSAFVIFYDKTAYYHQGASLHSKIPAPYLMQWEIIKEAKKRNCQFYNMWGVAPIKEKEYHKLKQTNQKIDPYKIFNKKHPWFGLSLFKTGFGGEAKFYLRTQDLPFNSLYWFNYLIEKIRKIKRRY